MANANLLNVHSLNGFSTLKSSWGCKVIYITHNIVSNSTHKFSLFILSVAVGKFYLIWFVEICGYS